jgi:hypothetical protein
MGTVISLDRERERRRDPVRAAEHRLDTAVTRLDPLVRTRFDLAPTIRRELEAIAQAVSAGLPGEAADRAERLLQAVEGGAASG